MEEKKIIKIVISVFSICILIGIFVVLGINTYVKQTTKSKIITVEEAKELENVDCILVLGAGIWENNQPSHMLEDRLLQGIELYKEGVAPKMIMSGDHGREEYDEVNVMKNFAEEREVASDDIFMDHAGFSTYESMYRAKEIFEVKKMVIVTQKYHLYRAIYNAEKLGITAYGVPSNPREYAGQAYRDIREVASRNKDFFMCILKPEPTYLGETIPVSGSGSLTDDK